MKTIAIKKGSREEATGFHEMGYSDVMGVAKNSSWARSASMDAIAAEKQANWLEKVIAEERERTRKQSKRSKTTLYPSLL